MLPVLGVAHGHELILAGAAAGGCFQVLWWWGLQQCQGEVKMEMVS